MKGGLFGLELNQKAYLYISQMIPTLIVIFLNSELLHIFAALLIFYLITPFLYINYLSLEKSLYPYTFY